MLNFTSKLYLASKSPRRRKLLKQIGLKFTSFTVQLDEEILDGEHPIKTVKRLSKQKMELARQKVKDGIIITADTIVVYNKEIIGKPKSKNGAIRTLQKLNGNTHQVYTGFCLLNARTNKIIIDYEKTSVTFNRLTNSQIKKYVASGSPMDKAGAYGIQDEYGAVFVKKINGCYNNVVGLPLAKIYTDLRRIV